MSLSVALGPGASSITDLALQLRVEPSRDDIPAIVQDILEDWHEDDLVCTDVFETSDVLEWVAAESGGVPGIAKRLCSALWDELQVGGCDVALSDSSRMAAKQRALDATYDVLRPRFLSMIASAANGGYNRPLELLAQAEENGFVASDTPGVRALTVMGLLAFSPGEGGAGGTYVIGMPGLLSRFYADTGLTLPPALSLHAAPTMSRSERKLFDALEMRLGETVPYLDIATHLVTEGVWASGVLDPESSSKLSNRVAVLAGRLRKRLEGSDLEIIPARGVGYVLRQTDSQ